MLAGGQMIRNPASESAGTGLTWTTLTKQEATQTSWFRALNQLCDIF